MDNSFEMNRIAAAMERQAEAMEALTAAIHEQTVTNQRIVEVLLEVVMQDQDPDAPPMRDMDGNAL